MVLHNSVYLIKVSDIHHVVKANKSLNLENISVDGGWSSWSSWSTCSPNCTHHKRRSCSEPVPANGGLFCRGRDMLSSRCGGGMCRPGHLAADSVSVVVTDLSLVIGLSVAVTVFLCVSGLAIRIIRSKRTSHSVYNMADICKFL